MSKQKNSFIEDVKSLLEGENVDGLEGWVHRFLGVRLGGQNRVFLL